MSVTTTTQFSPRPLSFETELEGATVFTFPHAPVARVSATRGELRHFLRERETSRDGSVGFGVAESVVYQDERGVKTDIIMGQLPSEQQHMAEEEAHSEKAGGGTRKERSHSRLISIFRPLGTSTSAPASPASKAPHTRSPSTFSLLPRSPIKRQASEITPSPSLNRLSSVADTPSRITAQNLFRPQPPSKEESASVRERPKSRLNFAHKHSLPNLFSAFQSPPPPLVISSPLSSTTPISPSNIFSTPMHSRAESGASSLWIRAPRDAEPSAAGSSPALESYTTSSPPSSVSLSSSKSGQDGRKRSISSSLSLSVPHSPELSSDTPDSSLAPSSSSSISPSKISIVTPSSRRRPSIPETALKAIMSLGRRPRDTTPAISEEEIHSWRRKPAATGVVDAEMEVLGQNAEFSDSDDLTPTEASLSSMNDDILFIEKRPSQATFDDESTTTDSNSGDKVFRFPPSPTTPTVSTRTRHLADPEEALLVAAAETANRFLTSSDVPKATTSSSASFTSSSSSSSSTAPIPPPKPAPTPLLLTKLPVRRPSLPLRPSSNDFTSSTSSLPILGGLQPAPRRKPQSRPSSGGSVAEAEAPRQRRIITDDAWHQISLSSSALDRARHSNSSVKKEKLIVLDRSSSKRRSGEVVVGDFGDVLLIGAEDGKRYKKINRSQPEALSVERFN